jgi:hypothetical protein
VPASGTGAWPAPAGGASSTPSVKLKPRLPWRPIWTGFAFDTVVFAVLAAMVYVLAVLPRRFVMEVGRMRRGCCIECGYDLGYDFRAGCPDCGWRRKGGTAP